MNLSFFLFLLFIKESLLLTPEQKCPECSTIRCPEVEQEDCPEGTILTENVMLGCCPACLKYLEYDDPCPGIGWEVDPVTFDITKQYMTWGSYKKDLEEVVPGSTFRAYYPDQFIEETFEMPCSTMTIVQSTYGNKHTLPERYFKAEWVKSTRNPNLRVPVIQSTRCAPNLKCAKRENFDYFDYKMAKCSRPVYEDKYGTLSDNDDALCALQECDFKLFESVQDCTFSYWKPNCKPHLGMFDAVQRKSTDSYYWCSDPNGEKIFGEEKSTMNAPIINCKCSRKHWDLAQKKELEPEMENIDLRNDVSLHCEENGNYEPLQCDKHMCWCVNSATGNIASKVLPENLMKFLPCYDSMTIGNVDMIGGKYFRKCESRKIAIDQTQQFLQERGSSWINMETDEDCEPTGGFTKTYCDKSTCECVTKGGKLIDAYRFARNSNYPQSSCNCARDKIYGLTYDDCDAYGNYNTLKSHKSPDEGDLEYCVNPTDNFRMSGQVRKNSDPGVKFCCLDSEYYYGLDNGENYFGVTPKDMRKSFACRPYESMGLDPDLNEIGSCRDCRSDIMDCDLADATRKTAASKYKSSNKVRASHRRRA